MMPNCPTCEARGEPTPYMTFDPDHYRCPNGDCRTVLFAWNPTMEDDEA